MSWVKKGINHLVLLAIGLIWVYPFLWMISASFKSQNEFFNNRLGLIPQAPTLDNIKRIWVKANFGSYFLNTVVVTCFAVVLVLIITMLAGYAMGRYKFVGRNLMMGIFVGSIAIPLVSTIIPTYEVVKGMHLTGTKTGLVLAQAGGAHVIFLMLFTSFFASIPMELEEAAKIDGCSFFQIYYLIIVPLLKPILATIALLSFRAGWNQYIVPMVFTMSKPNLRPLTVGVIMLKSSGDATAAWNVMFAGCAISIVPILCIYIIANKYFMTGLTSGSVKG